MSLVRGYPLKVQLKMGKIYDDWERLVQAVLHRELLRELGRQPSMSPSPCPSSISSDLSSRPSSSSPYFWSQPLYAQIHKQEFKNKEKSKLALLEDCSFSCTLEDILSAPAELLRGGRGTLGAAFKVSLLCTIPVLVRSLKELKATVPEFEQQMAVLAMRTRHENLVGIEAYFCFEDGKYLVYSYCHQPSVHSLLHDKPKGKLRPLDWRTRLRIAIGTARGLAHIHTQWYRVHGNIKASNIFLNTERYGCVSDLAFAATYTPITKYTTYHAPEVKNSREHSQESDVYSFGILLLELLTRKSPGHARIDYEVVGLDTWVKSVTSGKGTTKVFDEKLISSLEYEKEMTKVLLIGMHCVARKPELRPKMSDILTVLEGIGSNNIRASRRYYDLEAYRAPSEYYKNFSNWLYNLIDRAGPNKAEWLE